MAMAVQANDVRIDFDKLESMRIIFNWSQNVHKHVRCVKQMNVMANQFPHNQFLPELVRNIKLSLQLERKSPFTRHIIDFISKFLLSLTKPTVSTDDEVTSNTPNNTSNEENKEPVKETNTRSCAAKEKGKKGRKKSVGNESQDVIGMSFEADSDESESESEASNDSKNEDFSHLSKEQKERIELTDKVVSTVILQYLYSMAMNVRFNACVLVRKLMTNLDDIDEKVYVKLKKALMERCSDKDKTIRAAALLALQRFQDGNDSKDAVTSALKFHLKNDPDAEVRRAAIQSLTPAKYTMDCFVHATRDINDLNRKTIFTLIAEKIPFKKFSIDQRLVILKNGLHERVLPVKRVVETKMIPSWVKTFDGDLEKFLCALDVQSEPDLIDKMLTSYFNFCLSEEVESDNEKTQFHVLVEKFQSQFLDEKKALAQVGVENTLLWRNVSQFCKDKQITQTVTVASIALQKDARVEAVASEEQDQANIQADIELPNVMQQVREEQDLLDQVLPDLPYFFKNLAKFVSHIANNQFEIETLVDYEFIYHELLKMALLYEVGDEAQRQIVTKFLSRILACDELQKKFNNHISPLMKCLAKIVFSDSHDLLQYSIDAIDEIHSKLSEPMNVNSVASNPAISLEVTSPVKVASVPGKSDLSEEISAYRIQYAKITVEIEMKNDELETAKDVADFHLAAVIKEQMDEMKKQREELSFRLNSKSDENEVRKMNGREDAADKSEDTQSKEQTESASQQGQNHLPNLTDHPDALEKCLYIFCGCLEFGRFKDVTSEMLIHVEKVFFSGVLSNEPRHREIAVKGLGIACMISKSLSKQYLAFLIQVLNNDVEPVQIASLKAIFDVLCQHGFTLFSSMEGKKANKENDERNANGDASEQVNREEGENDDDQMEVDKIESNDVSLGFIGQIWQSAESEENEQEKNSVIVNKEEEQEEAEDFITIMTRLLSDQLESESDAIKEVAALGIGKLIMLGRVYSCNFLTRMLVLWYDPDITSQMRQILGVFLPLYSNVSPPTGYSGQQAFEECFLPTLELVYNEGINFVNLDHLINFLLTLLQDEAQRRLAIPLANKILTLTCKHELANKYLLRALALLRLDQLVAQDVKDLRTLMVKIEKDFKKNKSVKKLSLEKIEQIKRKLSRQMEQLEMNMSQTSIIEDASSSGSLAASHPLLASGESNSQLLSPIPASPESSVSQDV